METYQKVVKTKLLFFFVFFTLILNTLLILRLFRKGINNQKGKTKGLTALRSETFTVINGSLSKFTQVFGQVGEYHLTIEGYTSPFALVELSTGLFTVTERRTADKSGYFKFENILLHSYLSKEPCLITTDKNNISTAPLCLPTLPRDRDIFITGIILSPSLSLEKGQQESGKMTLARGYTTPNSEVSLYLFQEEKRWFWTNWVKKAEAKGVPIFNFKSNSRGFFEFNLPSYLPTTYRLFVASKFCAFSEIDTCANSPKSNTLKFQILSFWQRIIISICNLLYLLISILKRLLLNPLFLIILEFGIIFLLIFLLRRKKCRAITILPERRIQIKDSKNKKEEEIERKKQSF